MKIGRIIAITAVVCAAIGMTTQAEAAKRKAAGGKVITFRGCAQIDLLCGSVMTDAAGRRFAFTPWIPIWTPLEVKARKADVYVGPCGTATMMNVINSKAIGGTCAVSAR